MAKKKKQKPILIYPKLHSRFNNGKVERALILKVRELLGREQDINFILLSGQFFDTRGWAYTALRDWRGAVKPSSSTSKKPQLDATFACLSVYLSSLISFQADFKFAYEEVKEILLHNERDDLWMIIEEKLPFVSLPPAEMFPPGLKSPISPYYTLRQDDELFLGELYSTVFLSSYVPNLKSRFFVFFEHEGNTSFGYFSKLPTSIENFGFGKPPRVFEEEPTEDNLLKFISESTNFKDLLGLLIVCHNNSILEQFLVDDYETFLNKLLEIEEIDEGEG